MKKILVAYFSASGETAKLAKTIAGVVDGDLFEIAPEVPYTALPTSTGWTKAAAALRR
jgi:flavodoxin